jgi:hypothetical protein
MWRLIGEFRSGRRETWGEERAKMGASAVNIRSMFLVQDCCLYTLFFMIELIYLAILHCHLFL